ncbi:lactococcin 972 family bacteriocin [Fundicoccus culcitae]|uniref:Lactococcin 972 family bacteriocin n=1 Tax=Fundicoccus culcitae TaxID=2969821 RepID=A0ABY5P666_9LACT|nr:lactococcin 972 family bacteriocin [Fundicoccus culcitae]UUX34238.1 lactococcin 972 family bacteriocin [Fundicoccus culcitae]
MNKIKHFTISMLLIVSIVFTGTALAATVYPPEGGKWNYGVGWNGTFGYSDYLQSSRRHSSTVKDNETGESNKSIAGAGVWSQAKLSKFPPTGLSYFYNIE